MPKAVIDLSERTNRIVNIVKAKEGLKGKSEAIEKIVEAYEALILDPSFRPEFIESVTRARKGLARKVSKLRDLLDE